MAEQSNDQVAAPSEQPANPLSRRLFLAGMTATAALAATAAGGSAASAAPAQDPSEVTGAGWYPLEVAERLVGHRIRRAVTAPA